MPGYEIPLTPFKEDQMIKLSEAQLKSLVRLSRRIDPEIRQANILAAIRAAGWSCSGGRVREAMKRLSSQRSA